MQSHQKPLSGRDAGEARKLAAYVLLEAYRERVILDAHRALLFQLLDVGTATTNDVRAVVELPDGRSCSPRSLLQLKQAAMHRPPVPMFLPSAPQAQKAKR